MPRGSCTGLADLGNESCVAAVGCKRGWGIVDMTEPIRSEDIEGRFATAWVGGVVPGGIHCGSLYCKDGEGFGCLNSPLLGGVAAAMECLKGPWIIGIDFNMTPAELEESGWLEKVGGIVLAPALLEPDDRVIDYFVVAERLWPLVHPVYRIEERFERR